MGLSRVSPATYPIAATATARAYDFYEEEQAEQAPQTKAVPPDQQSLFTPTPNARVIPFDSLATDTVRRSIQARIAGLNRPAPLTVEKVEVRRPRAKKARFDDQHSLELFGSGEVSPPQSNIICDTPVAPVALRVQAGLIDLGVMLAGCAVAAIIFAVINGSIAIDKHSAPFLMVTLMTIPALYRLLWAFAGRDSLGMNLAGLRLVDFDGNPPSQHHRYYRIAGSVISVLAAGVGLIWSFVDQDSLAWHDHISGTFPTVASE